MAKGPSLAYIRRTMSSRLLTIEKTFPVQTRNELVLPKGYRANRKYPVLVALHDPQRVGRHVLAGDEPRLAGALTRAADADVQPDRTHRSPCM